MAEIDSEDNKILKQAIFWIVGFILFLIVGYVLTMVLVSLIVSHSGSPQAPVKAAKAEIKALADAERQAEIDTGYYVTLRTLDDMSGIGIDSSSNYLNYKIGSEPMPFAIETDGSYYTGNQFPASTWKGPYVSYKQVCLSGNPKQSSEYGSPLDPWGHPYKLYSSKLLTNPAPGESTTSSFTRNGLISYGPDGKPGNQGQSPPGTGDDIVYRF